MTIASIETGARKPARATTSTFKILAMGFLSSIIAACTGASSVWARQPLVKHNLDAVATVSLPNEFRERTEDAEKTPDFLMYHFRKMYKTHINGQTSWAEDLNIHLFSPDYPRARFDSDLAEGRVTGFGRNPGAGTPDAKGMRWLVQEITYERHPVIEPSWNVRVDIPERGLVVGWRGFKKQYTLEQAKTNLTTFIESMTMTGDLRADFATRRSWPDAGWESSFQANVQAAQAVLVEKGLKLNPADSLFKSGKWRVFLDSERPQRLHIVHELTNIVLPDGPFRLSEKVTYFKILQGNWWQDNQGQESGKLPRKGELALAPEFTDRERVYFYQIQSLDMWKAYTGPTEFADALRALMKKMESEHVSLMRDGFIAPDAEP
ncbi:MAG: hypothetical protein ACO1Q7_03890 [Gemmatimonas sp.]